MIKGLLKLGLLLVIGIVLYNYFMGTPEEKAGSERIFSEIRDLGKSVANLVKAEKEKFDAGKYDSALEKIGEAFVNLKEKAIEAKDNSGEFLDKINELELKKKDLEERLSRSAPETDAEDKLTEKGKRQKEQLEEEIIELAEETQRVKEKIEKKRGN